MDFEERYRAISARDRRFDGQFYTAVSSTGIYCRPSCPALTPQRRNVTFYPSSAAAHEAGYRACKRCLPDAVPGTPAWNHGNTIAARAMRLIAEGYVDRAGVTGLAARLGYSTRQLDRLLSAELGAGPLALARAHRAQTARTLLSGSQLPISDIAFASGFRSIRQFNDTVQQVFAATPGEIRERSSRRRAAGPPGPEVLGAAAPEGAGRDSGALDGTPVHLDLPYRAPFEAAGVFAFLAARALPGLESAGTDSYQRTVLLTGGPALLTVRFENHRLLLDARLTDLADLPALIAGVRRLFDLDADPEAVDAVLTSVPELAERIRAVPGIRVPGALSGVELLVRAIVGQQISVAAARTALRRLLPLGESAAALGGSAHRLFPEPEVLLAALIDDGPSLLPGPAGKRAALIGALDAVVSGELRLDVGQESGELHEALRRVKGIGPWTADYLTMRLLGAPDVLPHGDSAIAAGARLLGLPSPPLGWAAGCSPWRSYAALHLWRVSAEATPSRASAPPALTAIDRQGPSR